MLKGSSSLFKLQEKQFKEQKGDRLLWGALRFQNSVAGRPLLLLRQPMVAWCWDWLYHVLKGERVPLHHL
jgi:hypothetical protein